MRKYRIYNLLMSIDQNCYDTTAGSCDCPAGKGPSANCKHVGMLCYALVQFYASGKIPKFQTDCSSGISQGPRKSTPYQLQEKS